MENSEKSSPEIEATTSMAASATQNIQPLLPAGLSMPKPLKLDGNLATNWKRFKRSWDNYEIVARLNRFEPQFKTATFLSCIGDDALEMFEGMDFSSEEAAQNTTLSYRNSVNYALERRMKRTSVLSSTAERKAQFAQFYAQIIAQFAVFQNLSSIYYS